MDDGTCLYCDGIAHCKQCNKYPLVCSICDDGYEVNESNGGCVDVNQPKPSPTPGNGNYLKLGMIIGLIYALIL